MNKPEEIDFGNGEKIQYIYNAMGEKLAKKVISGNSIEPGSLLYCGSFVYSWAGKLQYLTINEGRIIPDSTGFLFEYYLKDHLGNNRAVFAPVCPGLAQVAEVNHYYPFGMLLESLCYSSGADIENNYLYNGKERQSEYGLEWDDYGARFYDPQIGRWHSVDPLAEEYPNQSPFLFCSENPVMRIDMNGMGDGWVEDPSNPSKGVYWDPMVNTKGQADSKGLNYKGQTVFATNQNGEFQYGDANGQWHGSAPLDGVTITANRTSSSNPAGQGGDNFSLASLYTHFQFGGGEAMTFNMSSVNFGGATQRDLGLTGMKNGEVRRVNLFDAGPLNQAALAFGRVNMKCYGNNQFSIVGDKSAEFNFSPLIDFNASMARNAGNVLGAAINYNLMISPAAALVPLIFGGPFPVYFNGTTTIPK